MSALTRSAAWRALGRHAEAMAGVHLRDLFARDAEGFARFALRLDDLLLDYAKNRVTEETMSLLLDLARQAELEAWRERMFAGDAINITERRAVLHVALRNRSNRPVLVDGRDVMPEINAVLARMRDFSERVRSGAWRGHTGEVVTDVVNIGIGGSDLGPHMACDALKPSSARTCAPISYPMSTAPICSTRWHLSIQRGPCSWSHPRPSPPRRP
jgi:glucose-6-phosphate isomerase